MLNDINIINPLQEFSGPYVNVLDGALVLRPGQGVRLLHALRELSELSDHTSWSIIRQALDLLSSASDSITVRSIWLKLTKEGTLILSFDTNRYRSLRNMLLQGDYNEAKGLMLYMLMWSHTRQLMCTHSHWSTSPRGCWEWVCELWGFSIMPTSIKDTAGPLPSLSAVYVGNVLRPTHDPLFTVGWSTAWRWEEVQDEDENYGEELMVADTQWGYCRALDLRELQPHQINCLTMQRPAGRRTAWEVLKRRFSLEP